MATVVKVKAVINSKLKVLFTETPLSPLPVAFHLFLFLNSDNQFLLCCFADFMSWVVLQKSKSTLKVINIDKAWVYSLP